MIGSDWPVCTLSGDYAATMGIVIDYVQQFSAEVRDDILGGNCARFYGINHTTKPTMSKTMLAAVLHGAKDLRVENVRVARTRARHGAAAGAPGGHLRLGLHYFARRPTAAPLRLTRPFILGHEADRRRGRGGGRCVARRRWARG